MIYDCEFITIGLNKNTWSVGVRSENNDLHVLISGITNSIDALRFINFLNGGTGELPSNLVGDVKAAMYQ